MKKILMIPLTIGLLLSGCQNDTPSDKSTEEKGSQSYFDNSESKFNRMINGDVISHDLVGRIMHGNQTSYQLFITLKTDKGIITLRGMYYTETIEAMQNTISMLSNDKSIQLKMNDRMEYDVASVKNIGKGR